MICQVGLISVSRSSGLLSFLIAVVAVGFYAVQTRGHVFWGEKPLPFAFFLASMLVGMAWIAYLFLTRYLS